MSTVCAQRNSSWSKRTYNTGSRFSVTLGLNMVNSSGDYPFGFIKSPKAMAFSTPITLIFDYRLNQWFSITTDISNNKWKANQGVISSQIVKKDVPYFSSSVGINIYIDNFFVDDFIQNNFEVFFQPNFGYFKTDKGSYSVNVGFGASIWITRGVAVSGVVQTKWRYKQINSKYNRSHQQLIIGIKHLF